MAPAVGAGALGLWICGANVHIGGHSTSSANFALIYAAAPVTIAAAGALWLRERMAPLLAAGVVLALAGVLSVIAQGHLRNLLAVRFTVGDAWTVVAALCARSTSPKP